MIEKIFNKKKLYALIVRSTYRKKKGVSFFTDDKATQQFGYMNHKKGHDILPHRRNKRFSKIFWTTEVIILLDGILNDLESVSDVPITIHDCDKVMLNPLFDEYEIVLDYCKMFISNRGNYWIN